MEHSDGIQLTLTYHPSGYLHQIIRTDNQTTVLATYQQDSHGHLIESNAEYDFHLYYTYDEQSQLIEWADRDQTWVRYQYNAQGQCVYSVGAEGFYEVWLEYAEGYTQARTKKGTTTFYYDKDLLALTQVVSPTGNLTHFEYDRYGNLLRQTLPNGEQIQFTYLDDTGLVKTFTDSTGATWQYGYESEDLTQDADTLTQITDPLNRTWTKTTEFAENGEEQTACFTAPDGSTTEFTRNQYGLLTTITQKDKHHQRQEQFHYDLRHRLIEQYDAEQRKLTFGYNNQDDLTTLTTPKGNRWRYGYTRHGKLQHIHQPNQGETNTRYDRHGNILSYTDPNQVEWTFQYGAFDLLTEKRDGEGRRWQYEYDKDSLKLTAVINPKGERYRYRYNAEEQIETETDFSGVQWHYGYDNNGNLATLTNSLGETNHYTYNANQQLIEISTESGEYCYYEYDVVGRLTSLTTLESQLTFEYDLQDRVIKETQKHGSHLTTLEWEYPDPQTRIRHITTELDGKSETYTTTYRYNQVGELVQLDLPADTSSEIPTLFCEYDENGNEVARYTKAGFQLRQTFDAMDNLTRQRAGNEPKYFFDTKELQATGIDAPTFAKLDRHYRYDLAQQTIQSEERNEKLNFTLNRNGQITEVIENHRLRESYRYDENGYLAQRHVGLERYGQLHDPFEPDYDKQPQVIDNHDIYKKGNQLDRLSETKYEYDEAGRVISRTKYLNQRNEQHETFVWNGFNQLTLFNDKHHNQWFYKYDGLGRRISKECPEQSLKVEYVWDGDQLALTLTLKQDLLTHTRHSIFNGWELLAQQDSYQDNHTTHYAVSQPNGKILGLFTPEGELAWKSEPTSLWGLYLKVVHHHRQKSPYDPEMLFAGQWLDAESGLAYNRFRYYDPETGNYLCLDPIGLNGGETPYSYVHNPLNWVDLFGLADCFAKRLGDFGENKAKQMLEQSGKYKDVFPVQNNSGHGIDLVGLRPDGKFDIFEVKTNITGIPGKLSKRQSSSHDFITNILSDEKAGGGKFGIPKQLVQSISENIGDTRKLDVFVKPGVKNRWYVDKILTSKW